MSSRRDTGRARLSKTCPFTAIRPSDLNANLQNPMSALTASPLYARTQGILQLAPAISISRVPRLKAEDIFSKRSTFRPESENHGPRPHLRDFTVAASGNLAVRHPQGSMAFHPGGRQAAARVHELTRGPFSSSRSNHPVKRRSRMSAAPPGVNGLHCAVPMSLSRCDS